VLLITKNDFTEERDGGSKRTAAVVRALTDAGYSVDYLTIRPFLRTWRRRARLTDAAKALVAFIGRVALSRSLSAVKWFSPTAVVALAGLHDGDYAATIVEHSQLALYGAQAPGMRVINAHNVESELMRNYAKSEPSLVKRSVARYEANALRRLEASLVSSFDVVVVVSDRDAMTFGSFADFPRLVVAENGVPGEFFDVEAELDLGSATTKNVVFIGHLGWKPNIDAAEWLVSDVWPRVLEQEPDARLSLVGRHPASSVRALAGGSVAIYGDVPSVVPFLASARVATAPLLAAGGTRIKILEALAAGVPVVSTSLGALGLEALSGEGLRIDDDPTGFAEAIVQVLRRPPARDAVRSSADGYRWTETMRPLITEIDEAS
jgi:glycosyltransferase involved in cell wall biosynthesis